jgi:hypothetical protein
MVKSRLNSLGELEKKMSARNGNVDNPEEEMRPENSSEYYFR